MAGQVRFGSRLYRQLGRWTVAPLMSQMYGTILTLPSFLFAFSKPAPNAYCSARSMHAACWQATGSCFWVTKSLAAHPFID